LIDDFLLIQKVEIDRYECKYIAEEFRWEITGESGWRF